MNPDTFRPLAGPFTLPGESWMLGLVIQDMKRGGIDYRVIQTGKDQVELWRATAGWQEVIDIEAEVQEVDQCSLLDLDEQEVLP